MKHKFSREELSSCPALALGVTDAKHAMETAARKRKTFLDLTIDYQLDISWAGNPRQKGKTMAKENVIIYGKAG